MATTSAQAGLEMFEALEIHYEHAYGNNPLKKACIAEAIDLMPKNSGDKVLDVGCGTGKPVSEMLSAAGLHVTGIDIAPAMIGHAKSRVTGDFFVADLLDFEPREQFAGVFIIFSWLRLQAYAEFYDFMLKYANAVQPGGLLAVGTVYADNIVSDPTHYDPSGTYVLDYPTPFMGGMSRNFLITAQGLLDFIESMGFRILSHKIDVFQPDNPKCVPEDQQYIIAKRIDASPILRARPEPRN